MQGERPTLALHLADHTPLITNSSGTVQYLSDAGDDADTPELLYEVGLRDRGRQARHVDAVVVAVLPALLATATHNTHAHTHAFSYFPSCFGNIVACERAAAAAGKAEAIIGGKEARGGGGGDHQEQLHATGAGNLTSYRSDHLQSCLRRGFRR